MKERKLFIFCLFFLIAAFGGTYFSKELQISRIEEMIPSGSYVKIAGQVYQKEEASEYQILYLKNISITYQNQSIKESRIIIYHKEKNQIIKMGNIILAVGPLDFFETASNPGNFDQKFYYHKQKIHGYIWADSVKLLSSSQNILKNTLYELRMTWSNYLKKNAGEQYGGILSAMLLGDKSSMDAETKELYQINGIAHILAISGLHLSFIGHSFYQIIRKGSGSYLAGGMVGLIFMALYILMIGVSVSALRAVVMFVLRVIADMSGRVYDPLTAVSLSAVVVILWRPLSFYDGGFQLSFGAIIGILFLNPIFTNTKKNKSFLFNSIAASLSVQIITLPILLYHYYEFPLYSIALNLIVVPLMSVVLLLAIFSVMTGYFWGVAGNLLIQGCVWILECYEWLCEAALKLPNARIVMGGPKMWGIVGYYMCVVGMMGIGYLAKTGHGRKIILAGILSAGMLVLFVSCPHPLCEGLEITMLDVGQGDCFYVRHGEVSCLIDGGSSSETQVAKYRIEPFLKCKGIDELDYVFVSHGDFDHISGIREMLERQREGVRIKTLVMPEQRVWDEALRKLAGIADEKGIKVVSICEGDVMMNGDLQIKCLYPRNEKLGTNIGNEASMVLDVSYSEFDMLFTGDIENHGEKKLTSLLGKQYDVLKVAHHGSKNSTSNAFLEVVNPKIGLVSAGENNSYGHPHRETMERLEETGCKVWSTAECGAVTIKVTKTVAKLKVFQYNSCYEKFE